MAITNATSLADFGTGIGTAGATLTVDNTTDRIGIGTASPEGMLQVGTAITMGGNTGIITAVTYNADSNLNVGSAVTVVGATGVVSATTYYSENINSDTLLNKAGTGAPTLTYGVQLPVGSGITGAGGINVSGACTASAGFVGSLTGNVTGNASGTAGGLSGTPDITVNNVTVGFGTFSGNISAVDATLSGTLTYDDVTNVDVVGFATFQKGVIVQGAGSTTTTLNVTGVSTLGVTSVSTFTAKGTLIEGMSSTTTAYSSSSDLNITNGNFQFSSANLAGTNNTLNIMSTAGINTDLATNQVMNVTAVTACNASTAYVNRVSIDGLLTGITTHWVGGSAPSDGGGSGLDTYSFNVMKTGSATYIVIANQVKTSS